MIPSRPLGKKRAPLYLVTFAGVLLLLFCCFVLLLSLSQFSRGKFEKAAGSLREAFGVGRLVPLPLRPPDNIKGGTGFQQGIVLVRLKEEMGHLLTGLLNSGDAELLETEQGLLLRLDDGILFESGTFVVRDEIKPLLQQLTRLLVGMPNMIYVVGHTDDQSSLQDNWSRSALYAAALVHFFATEGGLDVRRLEVRGMGQYAPRADNGTAEGRAKNRRIELIAARETLSAAVPRTVDKRPVVEPKQPAVFSPGVKP
ncbi:MAG: OmpA family protein [Magnetococcales bacterium]|nr:OmpA family protein [Magnetococcales bacterium]